MKSLIKGAARRLGYDIRRSSNVMPTATMEEALGRVSGGHPVETVVDVGASDGRWSLMARSFYPKASYVMFEAQVGPHGEALRELDASDPRMHAVLAAAGDHVGDTHFIANDPFGGAATVEPSGEYDIVVPMTTVDTEVERLGLAGPYLLKLDTHGFEVPILEGAASTLGETILLVIEVYNFELRPSALRFHELIDYLEPRGFRVIDLAGVAWRPRDRALWQMDLVFLRDDQPEFESSEYD